MDEEHGRITKVNDDGWAEVVLRKDAVCPHCGTAFGCGAGDTKDGRSVKALNRVDAKAGDAVIIVNASGSLRTAAMVYLMPAFSLILGAVVGSVSASSWGMDENMASILCGAVGVLIGFSAAVVWARKFIRREDTIPVITRVLQEPKHQKCAAGMH